MSLQKKKSNMLKNIVIPLVFLACYLSSFLAAGDGIAPFAYLLTQGSPEAWGAFQSFGFLGLIFFILGLFVFKKPSTKHLYKLVSLILIYLSWLAAVVKAGELPTQLIMSTHFQIFTIIWAIILHKSINYNESISLRIIIWPLCAISSMQLIDILSWDIFEKSISQVLGAGDEAYSLLSSINFSSQLFLILFFISVYFEFKKIVHEKK